MNRSVRVPPTASANDELRERQGLWQELVQRLDGLDVVATEVVRVRAATHHDCRT